jgi:uncharacterized protein YjbI with pentapeptide repeats
MRYNLISVYANNNNIYYKPQQNNYITYLLRESDIYNNSYETTMNLTFSTTPFSYFDNGKLFNVTKVQPEGWENYIKCVVNVGNWELFNFDKEEEIWLIIDTFEGKVIKHSSDNSFINYFTLFIPINFSIGDEIVIDNENLKILNVEKVNINNKEYYTNVIVQKGNTIESIKKYENSTGILLYGIDFIEQNYNYIEREIKLLKTNIEDIKNSCNIKFNIININVKDTNGKNINGVNITSKNINNSSTLFGKTNSKGSLIFYNVNEGNYKFILSKEGYLNKTEIIKIKQGENITKKIVMNEIMQNEDKLLDFKYIALIILLILFTIIIIFWKNTYNVTRFRRSPIYPATIL